MQALIAFIMQGRVQAIMATALTALMALVITPIAIVSMALPVLATLRNGAQEGLIVVASAIFIFTGLGWLLFGLPIAFAVFGITLWLPVWGLALILGSYRSLAKAISAAALGGFLLIGLQYLLLDSPFEFWKEVLSGFMQGRFDEAVVPLNEQNQLVEMLAQWMPGGVASSWFISTALALMLGRWASFKLDNTDAFGAEFRALRFERLWLIVLPFLLVPMLLVDSDSIPGLGSQFYMVGLMLLMLQGISLAHAFAHWHQANRIWLTGLYVVLFIGAPYSTVIVAALGYADGWLDFRTKVGMNNQSQ